MRDLRGWKLHGSGQWVERCGSDLEHSQSGSGLFKYFSGGCFHFHHYRGKEDWLKCTVTAGSCSRDGGRGGKGVQDTGKGWDK